MKSPIVDSDEYKPTNREKVRAPKPGCFYCPSCDKAIVEEGRKCSVCGRLVNRRRDKK